MREPDDDTAWRYDLGVSRDLEREPRAPESRHGPMVWVAIFECARADDWKACTIDDMRWLLCQYAARRYRSVLDAWVARIIHHRVAAQRSRWPSVSPATVEVLDGLSRWQGDREEIRKIRAAAAAAAAAAFRGDDSNAYDAADAAYHIACSASAASHQEENIAACYAADAAKHVGASQCKMLLDLARRLDSADRDENPS